MKICNYCGAGSEDGARACGSCGQNDFGPSDSVEPEPRKQQPETALPCSAVERRGDKVILHCRSISEALLVAEDLEREGMQFKLCGNETLEQLLERSQQERASFPLDAPVNSTPAELPTAERGVKFQVEACAYEAASHLLRSSLEFRAPAPVPDAEKRLSSSGKAVAMLLGAFILPGVIIFAFMISSYRSGGLDRKARDFKFWFLMGLLAWAALLVAMGLLA